MALSLDSDFVQLCEQYRKLARIEIARNYDLETPPVDNDCWAEFWRVRIDAPELEYVLLKVPATFPFKLPVAYAENSQLFGVVPHIDATGQICYLDQTNIDYLLDDISRVVLDVLKRISKVVSLDYDPNNADEIASEFHHYWRAGDNKFLSLIDDFDQPHKVHVIWFDEQKSAGYAFLACDDLEKGLAWVNNAGFVRTTFRSESLYIPHAVPINPPFPKCNADWFDWLKDHRKEDFERWEKFLVSDKRHRLIISSVESSRGTALVGWKHERAPKRVNGFRKGKERIVFEMKGTASGLRTMRYEGERIDIERLQRRTVGDQSNLIEHIVVVGLGSIGSNLIVELLQSRQARNVSLFDQQLLDVENILRHACSFADVGKFKATATADLLRKNFPWMHVATHNYSIFYKLEQFYSALQTASIIIFATGYGVAERFLVDQAFNKAKAGTAIYRTWVTAEAREGHVVKWIAGNAPCHTCTPSIESFSDPDKIVYEPGCGAGFAQYGGSRLRRFISVASDVILGPEDHSWHLTWTARPNDNSGSADEISLMSIEQIPGMTCINCNPEATSS